MPDAMEETSNDQNTESESSEDRANLFLSDFIDKLKAEEVEQAIVLIVDPKTGDPIVYQVGSKYSTARSLGWLFKNAKLKVLKELDNEAKI